MKAIILNAVLFQVGWFACVLAGANHLPWLGTAAALIIVAVHLAVRADQWVGETLLVLSAGILGALWDSTLVFAGLLHFPSGTLIEGTAPHWIIAMWMLFATTLNVSLKWLRRRWVLAAMMGAVSGPAAYYAGSALGGVIMPNVVSTLAVLALGWALMMPLLVFLATILDRTSGPAMDQGTSELKAHA